MLQWLLLGFKFKHLRILHLQLWHLCQQWSLWAVRGWLFACSHVWNRWLESLWLCLYCVWQQLSGVYRTAQHLYFLWQQSPAGKHKVHWPVHCQVRLRPQSGIRLLPVELGDAAFHLPDEPYLADQHGPDFHHQPLRRLNSYRRVSFIRRLIGSAYTYICPSAKWRRPWLRSIIQQCECILRRFLDRIRWWWWRGDWRCASWSDSWRGCWWTYSHRYCCICYLQETPKSGCFIRLRWIAWSWEGENRRSDIGYQWRHCYGRMIYQKHIFINKHKSYKLNFIILINLTSCFPVFILLCNLSSR